MVVDVTEEVYTRGDFGHPDRTGEINAGEWRWGTSFVLWPFVSVWLPFAVSSWLYLNSCTQAFLFQVHLHTASPLGVVAACYQLLVLSLFLNYSCSSTALCRFCALKNRDTFQQWWWGVTWAAPIPLYCWGFTGFCSFPQYIKDSFRITVTKKPRHFAEAVEVQAGTAVRAATALWKAVGAVCWKWDAELKEGNLLHV